MAKRKMSKKNTKAFKKIHDFIDGLQKPMKRNEWIKLENGKPVIIEIKRKKKNK